MQFLYTYDTIGVIESMERIGKIMVIPSSMMVKEARNINCDINKTFTLDMLATEDSCEDEEVSFVPLQLPSSLESRLFDHQRDGVKWMHGLYLKGSGGILGDDMGLGKTFQVTCLLTGLMCKKLINTVLIVAPVSVLPSWHRELMEHMVPHVDRISIELTNSDMNKKKRQKILADIFESGNRGRVCPSVVVTSYHLVANMVEDFCAGQWDYVVLDEGHLIKNHQTKNSKAMHMLQSRHRLVLTGTPVQNNLNEFWTIADWATSGRRFGSLASFKDRFATPISNGQDPHASDMQRAASSEAIKRLMALTKPILLQRKKCEQPAEQLKLPDKVEVVVWVPLASTQRKVYEQFLQSRAFSSALSRTTYPVEVINHLKTLCRHPFLLEASDTNAKRKAQLTERSERSSSSAGAARNEDEADDLDALTSGLEGLSLRRSHTDSSASEEVDVGALEKLPAGATVFEVAQREPALHELFQGSVKLRVLAKLVFRLHREGHRTLVFSQSRMMLDIIQRMLAEYRLASYRIDGTTAGRDRQRIIDEFNDPGSEEQGNTGPSICLLTTKACGTGITLTGADRVVIFDPSWNPAEDRQAVDRAFRIGQKKNVVVYRLVMASSVEEKMYEKQVFKDGLRVVTESGSSSRYFSSHETRALFTLGPADKSVVMEKFWEAAGGHPMRTFDDTGGDLPGVLGFTRHDTLYAEVRPQEVQDTTKDQSAHREGSQQWIGGNSGVVTSNKENERSSMNRSVVVDLVEGPFSKGGNRGGSSGSAAPRVEMDLTSPPKATVFPKPPTTAATGNKTVIDLRTSNSQSISGDDDDLVDTDEEGATAPVKSGTSRLVRGGNRGRVIVVDSDSEQEEQDEEVAIPAARYFEAEATEAEEDEELDEEQEEESGDCGDVDLDMGALTLSDEETPSPSSLDSIVCSDATLLVESDVSGQTNSIDIEAERAEAQEEDCDRTKSFIVLEAEGEDHEEQEQEQEAVVGGVVEGTVMEDERVAGCSAAEISEPHQSSPPLRYNNEQGQQVEEEEHFSDCDGGDDSCFPEDGAGCGLLDLCELGSRSSTVTSAQDTSSCSSNASNESFQSSYSAPRSSSALTPSIVAGTDVLSDASAACEWRLLPAQLPQQQPAAESYLFGFANPDIFSSPAPQQTRSSLTDTTGSTLKASIASSSILDLEQQLLAMTVHPSTPTTKVSFQTAPLASPLSAADISAVGVDFGGKLTIVASSAKRSRRSSFTAACMSSDSDDSERDSDAEHSSEDSDSGCDNDSDNGDESDCVTREQEGEENEEDCPVINLLSKFTDSPSGVSPSSSPLNDSPARSTPDRSSSGDGVQLFPEEDHQEENEQCYLHEISLSGDAVEQFSDSLASPEKQQLELSPEIGVGEVSDSWAVSEALLEREEEEEEEEEGQQGEGDGECGESVGGDSVSVLDDLQPQFISPGPFTTAEEESSSASIESDSPVATNSPPLFEKALPSTPLLVRAAAPSVATPELPPLSSPSEEQEEALDWSHFMHIPVLPVTDKEEEVVENFEMSVLAVRNAALLEALRDMGSDLGECCVFESQLPVSALDQTALQQYNELVSRGASHEAEGQLEAAGEAFLCALGLCDEDIALHGKLAWLLQTLSVAAEEQQQ